MEGPVGLTFEFTCWRRLAKPAVASQVQRRVRPHSLRYFVGAQHCDDCCTGGHGTLPKEQNTQQCPGNGRSIVWQDSHSWKWMQASVGMSSSLLKSEELMPTDACIHFHECESCHTILRPLPGHCCVFCSFGSVPCPPVQQSSQCCAPTK